ncbi:unnamed protein product [Cyprideis torosa]|uniref:Uncharacterized protein n=1 Tax=Cyprideis torosa TaxID=163714 RepID=A0A7R8ZSM1_9CRUS|nr:unnamed protein product [Cyprideis torosa]CAG0895812.1 unnamed protein product [Cyprideis torosa]
MVICSNGHNLCFSCSVLVNECPTCREQRLPKPIHNLGLEKIIKENMFALASVPEIDSTEITDLGRRLGRGSSAEVKAGLWHGGEVAIKVFQIDENDSYLKALKIESSVATRLQHPNVVRIYGITRMQSDTPAIVMERADKGSLRGFIAKLSYPQKVSIARGILEGIAYLHSRKVAHRDLKPENILLFGDKLVPKISDFGTSRIVQASVVNTMMTGTPKYCAPELLDKGLRYGTPVDVYSLSLILFELFTGEDPFKGCTSVMQVLAAIMRDQRPQIPSDFPEALKPLLEKGWSKDPLQRPPLTRFRDALQKVSDDLEKELAKKTANQLKSLTLETPSPESRPGIPEANDPRPAHRMSFAGASATSADEGLEGNICQFCGAQFKNSREFWIHKIGCQQRRQEELNRQQEERKRQVKLPTPVPRWSPMEYGSSTEFESPDHPASPARLVSHPSPPPISRQESTPLNPIPFRRSSPASTVEPDTRIAPEDDLPDSSEEDLPDSSENDLEETIRYQLRVHERRCFKEQKEELRRRQEELNRQQEERKREVKLPTPVPRWSPMEYGSSTEFESPDRPASPARLVSHPSPLPISRQESTPLNPIAFRRSSPASTVEPSTSFAGAAAASSSEKLEGIPCEFCGAQFNDLDAFVIHERRCFTEQTEQMRPLPPRPQYRDPSPPLIYMDRVPSLPPISRQEYLPGKDPDDIILDLTGALNKCNPRLPVVIEGDFNLYHDDQSSKDLQKSPIHYDLSLLSNPSIPTIFEGTSRGTPQGDPLSLLLFSLFIADLPDCLPNIESLISLLLFADDVALQPPEGNRCSCQVYSSDSLLSINVSETECMVFHRGRLPHCSFNFNGSRLLLPIVTTWLPFFFASKSHRLSKLNWNETIEIEECFGSRATVFIAKLSQEEES